MAIINNAHAGSQINLLCMIFRVIYRNNGKLSINEISELCQPKNLPIKTNQHKRFQENLRFWMRESHQLWRENDDSKLELIRAVTDDAPRSIAVVTNEALFAPEIENIFGKDSHGTEGLFRSLGCILASDQFSFMSGKIMNNQSLDDLFEKQLPNYIPNNSEKHVVLAYGLFLGFFEKVPKEGYIVDPTQVVKSALKHIFSGEDTELEAETFFRKLAEIVPLLDGGKYRRQVEENMADGEVKPIDDRQLSKSLSLALDRLRKSLLIGTGVKGDDSNAFRLRLPGGEERISTVHYVPGVVQ